MESLGETRPRLDEQLDTLAHIDRRQLLVALVDGDTEGDTPIKIDPNENAETVEAIVSMKHRHLPKLEDLGFVQWNREDHRVSRGPKFDDIEPLLEVLTEHRDELPSQRS